MAGQLDAIVSVSIQATNATLQLPNFGIPAVLAYHTHNTDFIRTYSSLAGMVTDSFTTTEPAYLMASSLLNQSPTVTQFKVIRGSTAAAMTATFTVTDVSVGDQIGYTVIGVNGTTTLCYVTATGNTTTDATAIAALTDPNGCTMTSSSAIVTITVTVAGKVAYISGIKGGTYADTTASASPATDLNAALAVDHSWYGVAGEHCDATNIAAIAVWAESNKRLHYYTTADSNNLSASSGIGNTLKTAGDQYSYGAYSGTPSTYAGCATMANEFARDPGTYTMAFKALAGVPVDNLTDTQITNLEGNNLNYYTNVAGQNIIRPGKVASGLYVDLRRGIDALAADIQFSQFAVLVTDPKVPYDPFGIAMLGAELKSSLNRFTATPSAPRALLRNDPGFQPQVILPTMANVNPVDEQNRLLKNLNFKAWAQNAVQTVQVVGTINF